MQFRRDITPIALLFAGIGSIVGSGWLFGPLYAAQVAGPSAIFSWAIGGFLMMIIAFTFAELGSAYPVAGGMIEYANVSHGPLLSFTIGWMAWISSIAVAPIEALAIVQYAASYLPNLVIKEENSHVLTHRGFVVAAVLLFGMCLLNYYSAKFFSRASLLIGVIKLCVPVLTILIIFITFFHPHNFTDATQGGFFPYGVKGMLAALPLGGVIYSFLGANTILQMAGESKNPNFSIPFAIIGSIIFCIILYSLLQVVFIGGLDPVMFAHGWHNLQYAGDSGPFAGMMVALGLSWFAIFVYADAFISPFGTGVIFTASSSRIAYRLSDVGFFPRLLQVLSNAGIPMRCIILNYVVGLLFLLPFPGWQKLASFIVSCFIVSYMIGPISLIKLRQTHPHVERAFQLRFPYATAFLAFYICNLLVYWTGWETIKRMMVLMLIGFLVFLVSRWKNQEFITHCKRAIWIIPYFILLSLISYLGAFGGTHYYGVGMDFILIGLMSLGILYWSAKSH